LLHKVLRVSFNVFGDDLVQFPSSNKETHLQLLLPTHTFGHGHSGLKELLSILRTHHLSELPKQCDRVLKPKIVETQVSRDATDHPKELVRGNTWLRSGPRHHGKRLLSLTKTTTHLCHHAGLELIDFLERYAKRTGVGHTCRRKLRR